MAVLVGTASWTDETLTARRLGDDIAGHGDRARVPTYNIELMALTAMNLQPLGFLP